MTWHGRRKPGRLSRASCWLSTLPFGQDSEGQLTRQTGRDEMLENEVQILSDAVLRPGRRGDCLSQHATVQLGSGTGHGPTPGGYELNDTEDVYHHVFYR